MRAGNLDTPVSIEYKHTEQDAYGADAVTWVRLALVWAEVLDVLPSKSEGLASGAIRGGDQALQLATDRTRVRMRYRPDITSDMRLVVHGGHDAIYQIVAGPSVIGRREGLELMCEKYTSVEATDV